MKFSKRIICTLLAVVLILTAAPLAGFAGMEFPEIDFGNVFNTTAEAATEYTSGVYTYTVSNGEATIEEIANPGYGSISIPSTIGGYPVTGLGYGTFWAPGWLTSVTIPATVKEINTNAFVACNSLSSVSVASSNKYYSSQNGVLYNKNKTKLVYYPAGKSSSSFTIPSGVEVIGEGAFDGCEALRTVAIADSVTTIETSAFYSCKSLSTVSIGANSSLKSIDSLAFGSSAIGAITIPAGVSDLYNSAFSNCLSLASITVKSSNANYSSKDGVLYNKIKTELIQYPPAKKGTSFSIPSSVTSICSSAFEHSSLETINISKNVKTIGSYAFYDCDSLKSITIPSNVKGIGHSAFRYCTSLSSVTLPNGIKSIAGSMFMGCTSLISITIPDSVTSIESGVDSGCSALTDVYYGGSYEQWQRIDFETLELPLIGNRKSFQNATIHYAKKLNTNGSVTVDDKNNIVIIPRTSDDDALVGVTMNTGNIATTNNKNNTTFSITSQEKAKQIKLSKTNYQDYIIPDSVVASWQYVEVTNITNFEPSYFHTAVMKKNTSGSKPYVSTVFAKESTFAIKEYVEIQSSKLKVHSDKNYTIFMSAGNTGSGISEYVIEQNANHKITSPDGVFTSVDLFNKLTYGLDCYAYVKRKDGTISELVKLNIDLQKGSLQEHLDSFQKNSKLNLLGKDFLKYKIPSEIPLFGDAEISFGAFQFPVGIEMEGDSIQISIGANIYKYGAALKQNSYDKYTKAKAEWFSDWKDIVNGVTVAEAIDKTIDKHLDAKNRYDDARENFFKEHWGKEDPTMTNKSKNFNVTGLGYIDATYMNGQLVIKDACLSIEGGYTFKYSQQGAIWVIPTYVYVEAGAPLGGSATGSRVVADNEVPFQWEWVLKITPKVNLGAGAGIKDFASLGLYANATMPIVFNLTKDVLTVDINGEFGAEAQFCIIKAKKAILTGTTRLLEHSWATKNTKLLRLPSYAVNTNVIGDVGTAQNTAQTEIVDRDYLSETSAWLGSTQTVRRVGASARALQQDGLVLTDLQTSVFEKAEPQVVAFGNKLLMTWVEDDATRDELNRMRLMYSIYDGSSWSQPKAVYDDGCNDTTPAIATDGTDVYFVWQKIASVITEETATIEHLVANTEIYTAVYDSASGEIKEVTRRTNNNCYDYAQAVAAENGEAVYYWATCEDNQMSTSLDNTIYHSTADNTAAVAENLAYILSIAAETDKFAYVTDADNDLATTDDINVFTVVDDSAVVFDKQGNEVAHNTATYGTIDGSDILFVSDGKNIYYESNGEIITILNADTTVNGLQFAEVNGLEYLFWTQNDEIGNVLYAVSYVDNTWTTPVRVSNTQSLLTCIDIAVLDNTLFGVCTSTEVIVNEEETTTETGATNLCWFRINDVQDVAITDIYIDEKNIITGQETDFSVYVLNNGTQTIKKLTITVADGIGNEYTVEKQVNLLAGCGDFVDLTYTAPENFTTTMLTVAVDSSNIADGNLDNNSKEKQIGVPQMKLTESEMMTVDEKYLVTAMLTNESDVEAENVAIHVHSGDNENVIYEYVVEKVEARGTAFVEFVVDENDLPFDENEIAKIYLQIEDSELYKGSQIVYIFAKKEATECAHSVTEVINIAEPSETQLGYTGDTICCGCGETLELGTEIPMICVHAWDDGVITTTPTCAEAGIKTFTCANDATHTYTEEIPAFGHSDEIIPAVDATCTATGLTEGKKCSACGEVLVEQIETPVLGHRKEILAALAPTCTTSGLTEGKKCTVCGEVTIEQTVVAALGHTEEVIPGKAATCTATGLTDGKKCTVCGEVTVAQIEIAKLAHSKVTVNQKAATATENGYTGDVVCSVCSTEISKGKVIPATGDAGKNCDHICHKDGFVGFIWKIVQFFWKLFKMNPVCECGKVHY